MCVWDLISWNIKTTQRITSSFQIDLPEKKETGVKQAL